MRYIVLARLTPDSNMYITADFNAEVDNAWERAVGYAENYIEEHHPYPVVTKCLKRDDTAEYWCVGNLGAYKDGTLLVQAFKATDDAVANMKIGVPIINTEG